MSGKMNWARAGKLYRRMTTDYRFENDVPDRAARWLQVAESLPQRRIGSKSSSACTTATSSSSEAPPW
jgi:hypothetical protein